MVTNKMYEDSSENRYLEILEELAKLSEWELRSLCLKDSDSRIIKAVLDYKDEKEKKLPIMKQSRELVHV